MSDPVPNSFWADYAATLQKLRIPASKSKFIISQVKSRYSILSPGFIWELYGIIIMPDSARASSFQDQEDGFPIGLGIIHSARFQTAAGVSS